ncbi:MAG: SHOCT domain-containing protein [Cyanobacteriota bacterium]|nr:SHOCT domain-containing protein [Cyanobacteriota bacterium]
MSQSEAVESIIRSHVLWAMGAGLIPIPVVDFAAVTAIQLDMLKDLSHHYGLDYSKSSGKAFVSALTGTTLARIGASVLKAIPGVGSVFGGVSMSLLSGASTYALGQVVATQFATSGSLQDVDLEAAKRAYEDAYEKGKAYVNKLNQNKEAAADVYQSLEKLGKLRDQGVITEEEFQTKKQELLSRL